jgi:hypothetical protein
MTRWLEEYEKKHAEFIRCINHFEKMRTVWFDLAAGNQHRPGYASFGRRQSSIYRAFRDNATAHFRSVGDPLFVELGDTRLSDAVSEFHEREMDWLTTFIK